jgi:hypothetical protein
MKLILLLLAIYSLIFYQHYKIAKLNEISSGSNGILKNGKVDWHPAPAAQKAYSNAVRLTNDQDDHGSFGHPPRRS